jgi:hypothetical protein
LPAIGAQAALVGVGIGGLTQSPPVAGTVMGLLWFGASNLLPTFSSFFRHELRLPASTGEERGHPRHVGAVDDLELRDGSVSRQVRSPAAGFGGGVRNAHTTYLGRSHDRVTHTCPRSVGLGGR